MKKLLLLFTLLTGALSALAATGTKADPLPLPAAGVVQPDFSAATSVYYTYTPAQDYMLTFSNMTNVNIYGYQITPTNDFYTETLDAVTYVQTRAGVKYTIEVTKGWLITPSSFTVGGYASAWPVGESWDTAVVPTGNYCYVPVFLDNPAYIKYTAPDNGVLSIAFNSSVKMTYGTNPLRAETPVSFDYSDGKWQAYVENVKAGTTYYFQFTGQSALCKFEVIHPVTGQSPDFPYTLQSSTPGVFPKEVGKYYYIMPNNGAEGYLIFSGNEPFSGSASAGSSFKSLTESSMGKIAIRMSANQYTTQYFLVLERTVAAAADQTFEAYYSSQAYDLFPGQSVEAGSYTTGAFPGLYYYTFTVPTDGRKIVNFRILSQAADAATEGSLLYANNQYSTLASGKDFSYEAVPGRDYTVAVRAAGNDAPVSFALDFEAPGAGASTTTAITAYEGSNSHAPLAGGATIYFLYTATQEGWLTVTPGAGTPRPAVSMMPIPSDPWMQACDVVPNGAGGYRVATENGRGYMIMFSGCTSSVNFTIGQTGAGAGESPSNAIAISLPQTALAATADIVWYKYTTTMAGKMVVSTNMAFRQSASHQDYSYVQIYNQDDPDNRIGELRPDYDNGNFADKILNVAAGTTYLIKVRNYGATPGAWLGITERAPIAGEQASMPINIAFDGISGSYVFSKVINYEADALWYAIDLPAGLFSMEGQRTGTFELYMYAASDPSASIATPTVEVVDYDEELQTYINRWSISGLRISTHGKYLFHVLDNEAPIVVSFSMATDGIADPERATVSVAGTHGAIEIVGECPCVKVYTIDGRMVASTAVEGSVSLAVAPGVYLVASGREVRKIAVK